jgi:hypothetical protein
MHGIPPSFHRLIITLNEIATLPRRRPISTFENSGFPKPKIVTQLMKSESAIFAVGFSAERVATPGPLAAYSSAKLV